MKNGQLKIWWKPQVPMKSFEVLVENLREAHLLLDVLADYDLFQLANKIKGDYCNMGGLVVWEEALAEDLADEGGDGWTDWMDESSGMDFAQYREEFFYEQPE